MKQGAEYLIQKDAVTWFKYQYPHYVIFSVPNEATYRNKTYFSGLGVMTGVSDVIVLLPNKPLFIEFKSKTGRQSVEQKAFQQKIEGLGYKYQLVRSVDDFIRYIRSELQ